ncbi:MAG: hypothetical protein ABIP33_06420 [Pseudolysinimonas sp.]
MPEIDFPTLGDLGDAWLKQHARVPDGFERGKEFEQAEWQFWCMANHYRIRAGAQWVPTRPLLNQAFHYRRSQIVGPQKIGKGPWSAGVVAFEACGPSIFGGWAAKGDGYSCADCGCGCGWEYEYLAGEPMGIRHPSPLIQLTALSEDQVANVYRPLRAMISLGPLSDLLQVRGNFIKINGQHDDPELDRIDKVTSSANTRVGNPISFALQDESGLATKQNRMVEVYENQRRGAAGMGGRTMETTNTWDPTQMSVAQRTAESGAKDVFRFLRQAPAKLSYKNARSRRRIHAIVYAGSPWVDLDSIEAEAAELIKTDAAQAERFFGNRIVVSADAWLDPARIEELTKLEPKPAQLARGDAITIGFDGSLRNDSTALVGCRLSDGHVFKLGVWEAPDDPDAALEWEVPILEVDAAVAAAFEEYSIVRMYCDPAYWQDVLARWASEYGDKIVLEWWTNRDRAMVAALERFSTAVSTGDGISIDPDEALVRHLRNTRRKTVRSGVLVRKDRPGSPNKIDLAVAAVLAYEARGDAIQAGALKKKKKRFAGF